MLMGGGGNPRSKKRPAPKGGRGGGADIDAMVADIMRYVLHLVWIWLVEMLVTIENRDDFKACTLWSKPTYFGPNPE